MQEFFATFSHPLALVLTLLGLIAIVYLYGMSSYWVLYKMNIPGAKPLPYVGNLLDMAKAGGIHLGMLEYLKKYGKVCSLCIGRSVSLLIAEPEMIKQIMVKDFHNFPNRYYPIPYPKRFKGLLQSRNEDWKRIRSTVNPIFASGKLKAMIPLIEKSNKTLVDKMDAIADTGKSVDILTWFAQMTLEVTHSTIFGIRSEIQSKDDNEFLIRTREALGLEAFCRVAMVLPFSKFLVRVFNYFNKNYVYFFDVADDILRAWKAQGIHGTGDLVDMLTAKNADGSRNLDDNEIASQLITFLVAGHENSSKALAMTAYHLALNPDIQERLRNEVLDALHTNSVKNVFDLLPELEYLECVLNEVMRLSPSAYAASRECKKPYTINGITIPAGMWVLIPFYSLHHDPEAWPDPDKFDPERFRGPAKESRHPFQFLPFGEGPRNCIGKRLSLLDLKITLVNILSKYKFVRCPETQVPLKVVAGQTLLPTDGVFLRIESCKGQ